MNTGVFKGIGLDCIGSHISHSTAPNKALISCSIVSAVLRQTLVSNSTIRV